MGDAPESCSLRADRARRRDTADRTDERTLAAPADRAGHRADRHADTHPAGQTDGRTDGREAPNTTIALHAVVR